MSSRTRTSSQFTFSQTPKANISRSSFDQDYGLKTAFDVGNLIPVMILEALPGDTFSCNATLFGRLATLQRPIMDNLYVDTHFFAVPKRLVWDNWAKFMGEQEDPGDSIDYTIPTVTTAWGENSLGDYFGLPPGVNKAVNSLPFRAYNLIWNEWFRDQDLQDSRPVPKGDGPDTFTDFTIQKRGKRHDYFTTCRPAPQKEYDISAISGIAPVVPIDDGSTPRPTFRAGGPSTTLSSGGTGVENDVQLYTTGSTASTRLEWVDPKLQVDFSDASGTINAFRTAFAVQSLLERNSRGGSRYTEIVRSVFGIISPDQRLQRPEYLGGGSLPLNVSSVAQTSETGTTQQANLAAYGTFAGSGGHSFHHSFTEHCYVIGLVSVRADLNYQEGIEKLWTRSTRYDFYWPSFAHIGEQAVLKQELYADGTAQDDLVFGYQHRYDEYRYKPSRVTSLMRSSATGTVHNYHLAQVVGAAQLTGTFIEEDPPVDRVIAVPSEPHILMDCHFKLRAARPIPMYGAPGWMDRF